MIYKITVGWLCILFLFISLKTKAELKDTLILMNDIEIRTSRLNNFALGTTIDRIGIEQISKNNSQSLTDIFSTLTGMSIKSYGVGGLSSLSIRGGGSVHTAVIWNGLNIQSPMNGMVNLSTMPGFLISDISIQQGGSGTLFGSGAVGGAVHLSSSVTTKDKNTVMLQAGYGSYNSHHQVFSAKTGDKTYAFGLKLFRLSATNDFTFTNSAKFGSPLEEQTNAGFINYGLMPELQVITSANSVLSVSTLFQKTSKNIQTMMTDANPNHDNQADENTYASASWKLIHQKYSVNIKSGIVRNRILMTDQSLPNPEDTPIADNRAYSFINELEVRLSVAENLIVNSGINYTHESGESTGYLRKINRDRISLFSSYKITGLIKHLNTVVSFRDEFVNNRLLPLTFSLGSDYRYNKSVIFTGNISKNYRIPAFNDLYWKPDSYARGNADLKPESGYSGELGATETFREGLFNFELSQAAFATLLNNRIIWLPDSKGIWEPDNKDKSNSKGLELRAKGWAKKGKSGILLNGYYTYTKANITSSDEYNGKQMIYVPEHRAMFSAEYSYKDFSVDFNFNHTGKRFYDSTHSLQAYQAGNLAFYYKLPLKKMRLKAQFRVNNIWGTKYQAMAWYAMPLRNYQVVLNLEIDTLY